MINSVLRERKKIIREVSGDTKENPPTPISFYETDEDIYEQVIHEEEGICFAQYNKEIREVTYVHSIEDKEKVFEPITSKMVEDQKVVLLPSQAKEFENEKELLGEIKKFINRYCDVHPFYLELCAHYVLLTWVFDRLSVIPYIRALGDYGSGKTRFIQSVGSISYKPMFLSGATSDAYLFRVIEMFKGSLVINEMERVNTDLASQITVILNCGYEKGISVGRVEGDRKSEPQTFDVFSPKLFSSRVKFKDQALESRIISIRGDVR